MVKDPVRGMNVEVDKAAASYTYKGETYYLCAESCKQEFVKNPEQFVNKQNQSCYPWSARVRAGSSLLEELIDSTPWI